MNSDLDLGTYVLFADGMWSHASWPEKVGAFLFGKRKRFEHLNKRFCVAEWYGLPYLLSVKPA